jgi:N-acetylglutamate synthase-like GNAT family acetyltransferase
MIITNELDHNQKNKILKDIFIKIKNEKNLSFRKIKEIKKYIDNKNIHYLFKKNQLIGFLFYNKLSNKLIEIHGLYLDPKFRGKGYSNQLIKYATKNKNYSYLGAIFLNKIQKLLSNHGFIKIKFNDLTLLEKINFLKPRLKLYRLKEVIRHKKKDKLILMKK